MTMQSEVHVPKLTIITAVYNRVDTIGATIESVIGQRERDFEYIIIDANSDDGTSDVIRQYSAHIDLYIRESDDGIYDALNKGIDRATGSAVGFLHADDLFFDSDATKELISAFQDPAVDGVYGDLVYVRNRQPDKVVRHWKSGAYHRRRFERGWMPPHPTVYLRRRVYDSFGGFRLDVGSAADYESLLRIFYKHKISVQYIPRVIVKMRLGGVSNQSLTGRLRANTSDGQAWLLNELRPPIGLRFMKPMSKLPQYVRPLVPWAARPQ